MASAPEGAPKYTVSELLKIRNWLNHQKREREAAIAAASDRVLNTGPESELNGHDGNLLDCELSELREALFDLTCVKNQEEATLNRILLSNALGENLNETYNSASEGSIPEFESLDSLVKQQNALTSDVLGICDEVQALKRELHDISQESLKVKEASREAMAEVRERQRSKDSQRSQAGENREIQDLRAQIDEYIPKIALLRHILQGLILGSGVNWAQDPELTALVIDIGSQLNFL